MQLSIQFARIASTAVPMFIFMEVRYGLGWGGFIHIAAPRTFRVYCPITKLLVGQVMPTCSDDDPFLNGCSGLPLPGQEQDPDMKGLPVCDPRHEVLLHFPKPTTTTLIPPEAAQFGVTAAPQASMESPVALDPGTSLLFSFDIFVPASTVRPRTDNIFRVRLLDANKVGVDGKVNTYAGEVRSSPRINNFRLWWARAAPDTVVAVAVEFTFNGTLERSTEAPKQVLRTIEIVTPERLSIAMRRPDEAQQLAQGSIVPITEWNWTDIMPRSLWFGVDPTQDVMGKFHYSFPVRTPTPEDGLPGNNLWQVKFCADSPYCIYEILNVPLPGFSFGDPSPYELDVNAVLTLSGDSRRPTLLGGLWLLMMSWLCSPALAWAPWTTVSRA